MKRFFLSLVVVLVCCGTSQAQLLYRISGNGLESPSYVIGTYHLAPASFAQKIPGLEQALAECKQVYGELDMEDAMKPENKEKLQKAQMLPEGVTLTSLLSKDELNRLNALMVEVMGVDMNNEAVASQMNQLSPAALSTTLTVMLAMKNIPGYNPMDLFDAYFQKVAVKEGKAVKGLETVEFQLKVLYDTPVEQQAKDLMCMVDNIKEMQEMVDFITSAFFEQDLEQIGTLFREEQEEGPCNADPEASAALIDKRNEAWLAAMPAIMSDMPTFFAVGAGHLVGEKGLLERLQEMGYKVEGVK